MSFSLFVAKKFINSNKKKTFINFLSLLSTITLIIGTASMIIVLSVFNGLEEVLKSIYADFDPEIKIENKTKQYFDDLFSEKISTINNVKTISGVLENKGLITLNDNKVVAKIKGVSPSFIDQNRIQKNLVEGEFYFKKNNLDYAVVGRGIKYALAIRSNNNFQNLKVFALKETSKLKPGLLNTGLYESKSLKTSGVFAIENNFDNNFIFTSLDFAQKLFNKKDKVSSYEIKVNNKSTAKKTANQIQQIIGPSFNVLTIEQQRAGLYKILQTEKFVVYLVFALIIILSSFNIFFLLSMMAIEKKKEISVIYALGGKKSQIKKIFIFQGIIIAIKGVLFGTFIGCLICYLQDTFGLISINLSSSIIENYPVKIIYNDVLLVALIVLFISSISSTIPANYASKYENFLDLNKK